MYFGSDTIGSDKIMKKIAIITLQSYSPNYGNCLQNYAVQFIYNKLGHLTKTELYHSNALTNKELVRIIIHRCSFGIISLNCSKTINSIKKKAFIKFYNTYIDYSINSTVEQISSDYDYYSVGSDQVWNYKWFEEEGWKRFTLSFADPLKRISISPSFGIETIDQEWIAMFRNELSKFKALSVREEAGAKIIKDLTGRDATVLVDPTMLLTKEEWRKISKQPKRAKEGYILTYFLSPKCDEAKTKLEAIREDREVYELLNPNDKVAGTAGPSEFLWLFDHADLILTDSFHACVFSFLFNKPFIVYDRNWDGGNMNSRLETLLSKFSLERKYANSGLPNEIWEHDYTEGYRQLEIERKKAIDFLKKALEG